MSKQPVAIKELEPRVLLLGIHAPYNRTTSIDSYFDEFLNLAKTDGLSREHALFIKLREINHKTFLTKGKLAEVATYCAKHNIDRVVLSEQLNAQQARNLEDALNCPVTDRTQLILEIFQKAAKTAEGKTQVEIAQLHHLKSRLAGKGIHLEQQAGMIGLRSGPGETLKEKQTRTINNRIALLKKQLERIRKSRTVQRKRRLESGMPQLCLIGYTNAGKSTLLNTLTHAQVLAEEKLFATLTTTTRSLYVDSKKVGTLSDTVGFIQRLPHRLVEAFKSTLEELHYADLLLHVVDVSNPNWEDHIEVVHELLDELGIHQEILYVFNKIDRVEDIKMIENALDQYFPHVRISAQSPDTVTSLLKFLATWQPQARQTSHKKD